MKIEPIIITVKIPSDSSIYAVQEIMKKINSTVKYGCYHCDSCRWISIDSWKCNKCGSGFEFET